MILDFRWWKNENTVLVNDEQKKYHLFCLWYHLNLYITLDRWMNIFLAVISTGSLVGLFTSDTYQKLLAVVLALTQIITAVSPYLPFEKRIKQLDKGISLLTKLILI